MFVLHVSNTLAAADGGFLLAQGRKRFSLLQILRRLHLLLQGLSFVMLVLMLLLATTNWIQWLLSPSLLSLLEKQQQKN